MSSSSTSTTTTTPNDSRGDSRRLAEFATKAAESFVSAYYAASDSPQRTQLVPSLYLSDSSIVWNGTPINGQLQLSNLLNSMPGSKHEIQAFDCHALGGNVDPSGFIPPSVLLTVSGTLSHYTPESQSAQPISNAPKSSSSTTTTNNDTRRNRLKFDATAPIESHSRAFSQNFVLIHDSIQVVGGGVAISSSSGKDGSLKMNANYFVKADSFRFVG